MQPSLQVRRVREVDAQAYYALRRRSFEESAYPLEPQLRRELKTGTEGIVAQLAAQVAEGTCMWAALSGETMIGTAALSREYHASYGGIGVLWGVYVLPRYRGTPASRLLMDAVVGFCGLDSTIGQILAPCAMGNQAGLRFLQRFGFEPMTLLSRGGSVHGHGGTFGYLRRPVR